MIGTAILLAIQTNGQTKETMSGLWLITEVKVGNKKMTPDAKWSRFNEDGTQESGNGWFQHSYGSWELDEASKELSIITENGLDDPFGAFNVEEMGAEDMVWSRVEEGEDVRVVLERIERLPSTNRDRLIGLWEAIDFTGRDSLFGEEASKKDYLFIRWDGKFVVESGIGKTYGVYNVHAHKPEIELIPYGSADRSFWKFSFLKEGEIEITLLNREVDVKRTFRRVRNFPQ